MSSLVCSQRILPLLKSQSKIASCINVSSFHSKSWFKTQLNTSTPHYVLPNKTQNLTNTFLPKCNFSSKKSKITKTNEDSEDVVTLKSSEKLYRAMDILVLGHELEVLESYLEYCSIAAKELDITVNGVLDIKFINDRMTLLRSVHIYKKHRTQYEARTYRRVLQLKYLTQSTMNIYLEYIQRNIPYGVAMHVHKWEIEKLPKHIQEAMKKNVSKITDKEWEVQFQYMKKMKQERNTNALDYEEYKTTQQYLLGTTM